MKMFIPKVGDLIRVTDDVTIMTTDAPYGWKVPDLHSIWTITHPDKPWDYKQATQHLDRVTLVKGLVLKFKRLFVSAHAKTNAIEVSIFAHPDPRCSPRAQGGKAKATIAFTLTTEQVNEISYERVQF